MPGNFSWFCCLLLTFSENSFGNTIRVSNGWDPDQDWHFEEFRVNWPLACWVFFPAFVIGWLFSKSTFSKNSFKNTIRVSNGWDSDQDRHFVGPDLGPNYLQRLSANDKSHHAEKELIEPRHEISNNVVFWQVETQMSLCSLLLSLELSSDQ